MRVAIDSALDCELSGPADCRATPPLSPSGGLCKQTVRRLVSPSPEEASNARHILAVLWSVAYVHIQGRQADCTSGPDGVQSGSSSVMKKQSHHRGINPASNQAEMVAWNAWRQAGGGCTCGAARSAVTSAAVIARRRSTLLSMRRRAAIRSLPVSNR